MAKVRVTTYVHADKESMWDKGEELGLTGEALKKFAYALYEVTIPILVDTETGEYTIIKEDIKG